MIDFSTNLFIYLGIFIVSIFIIIFISAKIKKDKHYFIVEEFERKKVEIVNTPVAKELSKLSIISRNEDLDDKYNAWQKRWKTIFTDDISKITDLILELESYVENSKYTDFSRLEKETELLIINTEGNASDLLNEIKSINSLEEQQREIITNLKAKLREVKFIYKKEEPHLDYCKDQLLLKFDMINDRLDDFEVALESQDFTELSKLKDSIEKEIESLGYIISRLPEILLLAEKYVPKRLYEVHDFYKKLIEEKYPLEHLDFEYNINESNNTLRSILDRIKILNISDTEVELKALIEFCDVMYYKFETEDRCKAEYLDDYEKVLKRIKKINKALEIVVFEFDSVKETYDLESIEGLNIENTINTIDSIQAKFNVMSKKHKEGRTPYSSLKIELDNIMNMIVEMENSLANYIDTLDGMREDENRAHEQVLEIRLLMRETKRLMKKGKLPVIPSNFLIQLEDSKESMDDILTELNKSPINVEKLNTRVDTARDLVFKVYNTSNELLKTAMMVEKTILYGNRYRSSAEVVHRGLETAENLFKEGNYEKSLGVAINSIEKVEPGFYKRLMKFYDRAEINS